MRSPTPPATAGHPAGAPRHTAAAALRYAATRAVLAPSVHNTQPWRLVLRGGGLELWADRQRQLMVLDPEGRQLIMSCGCALLNARVALAARGFDARVHRYPDDAEPALLARVTPGRRVPWSALGELDPAVEARRTNRRAFLDTDMPLHDRAALQAAASAEGATLIPLAEPALAQPVAALQRIADRAQQQRPGYEDEVLAWTTDDPRRVDGVSTSAIPYAGPLAADLDPVPLRRFDLRGLGWLPSSSRSGTEQMLMVLAVPGDQPVDWLRAGEALQRVWLVLTQLGYSASPLNQIVEVPRTRAALRRVVGGPAYPAVMLRVGRAADVEPSARRPLSDVLVDDAPA